MALHDNLKAARGRAGMSQELVAERLGVSRQAVTKWELGQSRPNAKNLQALAELYQVSAGDLLTGTQWRGSGPIAGVGCADRRTKRSGMDFLSVLTLIFVVLKADLVVLAVGAESDLGNTLIFCRDLFHYSGQRTNRQGKMVTSNIIASRYRKRLAGALRRPVLCFFRRITPRHPRLRPHPRPGSPGRTPAARRSWGR